MERDIITRSRRRELDDYTDCEEETQGPSEQNVATRGENPDTRDRDIQIEPQEIMQRENVWHHEGGDTQHHRDNRTDQDVCLNKAMEEMKNKFTTTLKEAVKEVVEATQQGTSRNVNQEFAHRTTQNSHRAAIPRRPRRSTSTEYTSEEDLGNISDITPRRQHQNYRRNQTGSKLPPFTGKEPWKVWMNRFSEVARLRRWSNEQKLDEILPRLQGPAGEFVYGQLSHQVRTNYEALTKELNNRFRVVETSKTFGAQFSNRNQKPGESVEEYAAELKRLYDKAHANRDHETRKEDLLRKFLDGLADDHTRFHVEYVKDPEDIDEAVYEVVNFQETKRRPNAKDTYDNKNKRPTRKVSVQQEYRQQTSDSETSAEDSGNEEEIHRVGRTPAKVNKSKPIKKDSTKEEIESKTIQTSSPGSDLQTGGQQTGDISKITSTLQEISERLTKLENGNTSQHQATGARNYPSQNRDTRYQHRSQDTRQKRKGNCYHCGIEGHFARECGNAPWMTGQMQVAVQPGLGHNHSQRQASQATVAVDRTPVTQNQSN